MTRLLKDFLMEKLNYFFDENHVRYTLVSTRGVKNLNWLFIPGGPGGDSSYFYELAVSLGLSGNTWLLDFPGNGSNHLDGNDFEQWYDIFIPTLRKFENPIVVGHSFGGMFPLLFEELENVLSGFVILNSSPGDFQSAAAKVAKLRNLPSFGEEMTALALNPSQETFDIALAACAPYYFPEHSLEQGRLLLNKIAFNYKAPIWWLSKFVEEPFNAKWVPKKVKTLNIGGEFDAMCPFTVFQEDDRFARQNIIHALIKDAGHFPWIEKPQHVHELFKQFEQELLN